jgi:hypothetical protein
LTCRPRKHVQTWRKLGRAFLLVFRELHGNDIPYLNEQGKEITERGEFDIFSKERIRTLIRELRILPCVELDLAAEPVRPLTFRSRHSRVLEHHDLVGRFLYDPHYFDRLPRDSYDETLQRAIKISL